MRIDTIKISAVGVDLELVALWQVFEALNPERGLEGDLVLPKASEGSVKLDNSIGVLIVEKRFRNEKVSLAMGDPSRTNGEVGSDIVLLDESQRLVVVNLDGVLVAPVGVTCADGGIDSSLHPDDAAMVQPQLRSDLDGSALEVVFEQLPSVLDIKELTIGCDALLTIVGGQVQETFQLEPKRPGLALSGIRWEAAGSQHHGSRDGFDQRFHQRNRRSPRPSRAKPPNGAIPPTRHLRNENRWHLRPIVLLIKFGPRGHPFGLFGD